MPNSINDTIRILRNLRGYKQSYMASKMSITQQDYSHLEKHGKNITNEQRRLICEILEVEEEFIKQFDADILLKGQGNTQENFITHEFLLSTLENKDEVVMVLKAHIIRLLENIVGLRNQIKEQNETIRELRQLFNEMINRG